MFIKYFSTMLFFAACLALSPCYGDTNILVNPAFEDSNGWTDRSCTFTYTAEQKHSGSKSGKASGRTENWQGIKQSVLGKMENGKTYQISGWVRLENAIGNNITASVEQQDGAGTQYFNVATVSAVDNNWVQLSGSFTPNFSGPVQVLDVYFEGPAADVNFYVDDVNVFGPSAAAAPPAKPPAAKPKPAEPNAAGKGKVSMSINRQINYISGQNAIKE